MTSILRLTPRAVPLFVALFIAGGLLGVGASSGQATLYSQDFDALTLALYPHPNTVTDAPEMSVLNLNGSSRGQLRIHQPSWSGNTTTIGTLDRSITGNQNAGLVIEIDLSALDTSGDFATLDFEYLSNDTEGQSSYPTDQENSVYIRGSNTDSWIELFDWCNSTSTFTNCDSMGVWTPVSALDVTAALAGATQNFSSTFQVRFSWYDNGSASSATGSDGLSLDNIVLECTGDCDPPPPSLVLTGSCNGSNPGYFSFDSITDQTHTANTTALTDLPDWRYEKTTDGRLRLGLSSVTSASDTSATLDMNPANATPAQNWLILEVSLSDYDAATEQVFLDFDWMDHGDENHAGDRIEIRDSRTGTWRSVNTLLPNSQEAVNGAWNSETGYDLSAILDANSETFSGRTQIRFGQEDTSLANNTESIDGISYDDVCLRAPGAPTNHLTGLIYGDTDGDATQDPGETGLLGAELTLVGPGCSPCTTTANSSGAYLFENLVLGTFFLDVNQESLVRPADPTTVASLPTTVTIVGLSNTAPALGLQYLDVPGTVCDLSNPDFERFDLALNAFLPMNPFGPFTGTVDNVPGWTWETLGGGNSKMTSGNTGGGQNRSGPNIKSVGMDPDNIGQTWLILTRDLSALDPNSHELLLNFSWTDTEDDGDPGDVVQIRGSNTDAWITVHEYDPALVATGVWTDVADMNLLSSLEANGQNVSSTTQVRFGAKSSLTREGGVYFDDVCLRTGDLPTVGSVSGVVFNDYDQDGLQDSDEPRRSGVAIEITGPLSGANRAGATCAPCSTTTDLAGQYSFTGLALGNYSLSIGTASPSPPSTTPATLPVAISMRPGGSSAPPIGLAATRSYTANTVISAKTHLVTSPPNAELLYVDVTTGSTTTASVSPVTQLNSMGADADNCQVYYGNGTTMYRWNAATDTHTVMSDLAVDYPATFTGGFLESAGGTFYNPTDTYWLAAEGQPGDVGSIEALYEVVLNATGTAINSITRHDIRAIAAADPETPLAEIGRLGDVIVRDNGAGNIEILGATKDGPTRDDLFWTYDHGTGDFVLLNTLSSSSTSENYQLAMLPDGTIYTGKSQRFQRLDDSTGTLVGGTLDVPDALHIDDMTNFFTGCLPQIGLAKTVSSGPIDNLDGTWTVGYKLRAETFGYFPMFDVQVTDSLTSEFGTHVGGLPTNPGEYTISAGPTLSNAVGGAVLTANPAFDGSATTSLLTLNPGDTVPVGATIDIDFSVRFFPPADKNIFVNQALIQGDTTQDGTTDATADDLSDDGADPDPGDGSGGGPNGNPEDVDESDPTVISINTGYDLALLYTYLSDNSLDGNSTDARVRPGDEVVYQINLLNPGTQAMVNPEVRAYIEPTVFAPFSLIDNPNAASGGGVSLPYTWAISGGHGIATLNGTLPAGQQLTINVVLTVATDVHGSHLAYAEVWDDSGADIDSIPESEQGNNNGDTFVDNVIDGTGGDEDDHDGATISVTGGGIGDYVWHDANHDGVQNGGETGIAGVLLRLYLDDGSGVLDGADTLVGTTTSDSNGFYGFFSLDVDNYIVDLDETTLPAGMSATVGTGGDSGLISLASGQFDDTADFGYASVNSIIGDFVWYDTDGDGQQDPGEIGIAGVQLTVTGPGYSQVAITDLTGHYQVTGVTTSGTYQVAVTTATLPPGVSPVPTMPPMAPMATFSWNVTAGIDLLRADFGFNGGTPATLGDLVWNDVDGDGVVDSGEAGIGNVTVDLIDSSGNRLATTTTDSNGFYDFSGIFPGAYRAEVTDSHGVLVSLSLCSGSSPTALIPLAAGNDYNDADFGYCASGSGIVGNLVFLDENANGVFDTATEAGIEHVTLQLYEDSNGNGTFNEGFDSLIRTTTTNSVGRYEFGVLGVPATYFARVQANQAVLAGLSATIGSIGVDENSQPSPFKAELTNLLPEVSRADFGFVALTSFSISGTVFSDSDNDGVHDQPEEVGVLAATVRLYRDLDNDGVIDPEDPIIGTKTTDGNGDYSFGGLPGGGTNWLLISDVTDTTVSGGTQTTQLVTGGLEPVQLLGANVVDRDFGYTNAPTRALIESFEARTSTNGLLVEWSTSSEIGTVGFLLYRWHESLGDWTQVGEFLSTPGLGSKVSLGAALGATYRVLDEAAESFPVEYLLLEKEVRGGEWFHGPYVLNAPASSRDKNDRPGTTLHPVTGLHLDRRPAQERGAQEPTTGTRARLVTTGEGIYLASSSDLALSLNTTVLDIEQSIANQDFRLSYDNQELDWWTIDGSAIAFYVPSRDSLFARELDVFLRPGPGRIAATHQAASPGSGPGQTFDFSAHFEENLFGATAAARDPHEDFWFWHTLVPGQIRPGQTSDALTLEFDLPGHAGQGQTVVELDFYGATESPRPIDHEVSIYLNGLLMGTWQWDGAGRHSVTFEAEGDRLLESGNTLRIEPALPSGLSHGVIYFDALNLTHARRFEAASDVLRFTTGVSSVHVSGFNDPTIELLDITNPHQPVRVNPTFTSTGQGNSFDFLPSPGSTFYAAGEQEWRSAVVQGYTPIHGLSNSEGADYLVIAPPSFVSEAQRLADLRLASGLMSRVISSAEIFDSYSFGVEDPQAIHEFLKDAWQNWTTPPRWVAMVGKGSFDFRNELGHNTNLLPTPLVGTPHGLFAADASLGDVLGSDGVPEIAIGRIPVVTVQELSDYIDKLELWESATAPGSDHLLLAHDQADSAGDFAATTQSIAANAADAYITTLVDLNLTSLDDARSHFFAAWNDGSRWVNYVGHGGLDRMTGGGLLTVGDVPSLQTVGQVPIVSALSCAVNRFEVPGLTSLGEALTLSKAGGALAVFAPTGLSKHIAATDFGERFLDAALHGTEATLGEALLEAYKSTGAKPEDLATYLLLGDPALPLTATGTPNLLFDDDFESGTLLNFSLVVP